MTPQWPTERIRDEFGDPDASFGMTPMWMWTGDPTVESLLRQLESLRQKGLQTILIVPSSPLRCSFLTDAWWDLLLPVVARAKELGMRLWLNAELNYPAGEGRYVGPAGPASRTLEARPQAHMKRLALEVVTGEDGHRWTRAADIHLAVLVDDAAGGVTTAAQCTVIDGPTQQLAPGQAVYAYRLVEAIGIDGGLVDLMSRENTQTYIDQVLEPIVERLASYIPSTVSGIYIDHEGSYGAKVAWTPGLFDAYAKRFGRRLEPLLPLLGQPVLSPDAIQTRCDYFRLVGSLYARGFFREIRQWCEGRGLAFSGHVFEESMQLEVDHVGDLFAVEHEFGIPGGDALFDWGLHPRQVKDLASVAAIRGVGLAIENEACLGMDSYRDIGKLRPTSAALALWGTTTFMPFVMSSDEEAIQFPPLASEQPWWRYFGLYVDSIRRASFVNAVTAPSVDVVVVHPKENMWAYAWPLFEPNELRRAPVDPERWGTTTDDIFHGIVAGWKWGNQADADDSDYAALMEALVQAQLDFLTADSDHLGTAVAAGQVTVGTSRARFVVVPPCDVLAEAAVRALLDVVAGGGEVVFVGRVPRLTAGPGEVSAQLDELQRRSRLAATVQDVPPLLTALGAESSGVVVPSGRRVRSARRATADGVLLGVANLETEPVTVAVPGPGARELWFPDTGAVEYREPTASHSIDLDGGAICYVREATGTPPTTAAPSDTVSSTFDTLAITDWSVEPTAPTVPITRVSRRVLSVDIGDATPWSTVSLRPEVTAERDWWVAGNFPNWDWSALVEDFGPEGGVDLDATYAGVDGPVTWRRYLSPTPWVNLDVAHDPDAGVGMFDTGAAAYAFSWIDADSDEDLYLHLLGDTCVDVWVGGEHVYRAWEHKQVVEATEEFTSTFRVPVTRGRTSILLKIVRLKRTYLGGMGFLLRLADADENPSRTCRLDAEPLPGEAAAAASQDDELAEIRIVAPDGTDAVLVPDAVYATIDSEPAATGELAAIRPGQALVLGTRASQPPIRPVEFRSARTSTRLGSLPTRGLADFVGTLRYTARVHLSPRDASRVVQIDCGDVGVVADVRINDVAAGVRAWEPFVVDVAGLLRPGENTIEVLVTNTAAARRVALPEFRVWNVPTTGPLLEGALVRNGLIGPVTLRLAPAAPPPTSRA